MPTHPLNKAYRPGAVDSAKVQQKIRITNNYSDFIKNFLTDDPPIPYSLFPTPCSLLPTKQQPAGNLHRKKQPLLHHPLAKFTMFFTS